MKISEILLENTQLDEGPIGSLGTAVGKGVGGVAHGLGAVAGGVRGAWDAMKKGFQTGKSTVGGVGGDPNAAAPAGQAAAPGAAPAQGAAPAAQAAPAVEPAAGTAPTAQDINAQGPAGTAPAKQQTGAAAAALAKTDQATQNATADKAGQTVYAQVKSQINNLDKKGKQRILQLLTKSLQAAPAKVAAPAGGTAAPAAQGGQAAPAAQTAAPAATPAAQTAATPVAEPAAPGQEPAAKPKRTRNKKTAAAPAAQPTQAEIDADRERIMGVTSDSIIRTQASLVETLMKAIAEEKRRMISEGKISIFRQYH